MNLIVNLPTPCRVGKRLPAPEENSRPSRSRRWRVPGVKPGSGSPPKGGGADLSRPAVPFGGGSGEGKGSGGFCGGRGLASSALWRTCATLASSVLVSSGGRGRFVVSHPRALRTRVGERGGSHNTNNLDLPSYEITTRTTITTRRATAWHAAWWRISQVDDKGVGYM